MTISSGDVEAIVRMFEQSKWKQLELRVGNSELFLSKEADGRASFSPTASSTVSTAANGRLAAASAVATPALSTVVNKDPTPNPLTGGRIELPPGCVHVSAPSLGTFYRSPKPGAALFVELGQEVTEDTELCLIEVMKLFTTLRAEVKGTIREILVKDGDLVEYGQPLFVVQTNG
ncbi:acetyl-CoA carboxylase biotin carboxyl carrier protein [Paraburkholderia aspalathi]|uniref:Biotin carboxyl carrier protein of acetyl-CoA carboxylase n=1 Tax=Paraburkholderia aspalathi TaxID=1324617 RepID=A0A1I7E9W2_9BURK|nr:biotin/lipoyl-containing protein [Paraburkholderia aspalathi]SFU20682.1 acetyl-CoA carboxylase biotin carboxyl carrier protein [Paraburkholderia aspalathi]